MPIAICLGNAFLLKPSEQVPLSPIRFAELLNDAGLPENVFQVLQGDKTLVEAMCLHPGIEALSFVGSTPAANSPVEFAGDYACTRAYPPQKRQYIIDL